MFVSDLFCWSWLYIDLQNPQKVQIYRMMLSSFEFVRVTKVTSLGGSGAAKNSWHLMFPLGHAVWGGGDGFSHMFEPYPFGNK